MTGREEMTGEEEVTGGEWLTGEVPLEGTEVPTGAPPAPGVVEIPCCCGPGAGAAVGEDAGDNASGAREGVRREDVGKRAGDRTSGNGDGEFVLWRLGSGPKWEDGIWSGGGPVDDCPFAKKARRENAIGNTKVLGILRM